MDLLDQIKQPILEELEQFKQMFQDVMQHNSLLLNEVLQYIHGRNGKLMRPILTLLSAKYMGRPTLCTMHTAIALELLHTASLVHDDVVDESEKRRGQLSVNAVYNNKISVLTGDYLLASSLKEASETALLPIIRLITLLGQQLSEGELLQLDNTRHPSYSETTYFDIIRKKTATLFATCTEAGALSMHAPQDVCKQFRQFGEYIGIAFQIKDDIFDYGTHHDIGKPTGNDMQEGKLTLPALFVLNAHPNTRMQQIASHIKEMKATDAEIAQLVAFTIEKGGIDYAREKMHDLAQQAIDCIPADTEPALRTALEQFVSYVTDRDK